MKELFLQKGSIIDVWQGPKYTSTLYVIRYQFQELFPNI